MQERASCCVWQKFSDAPDDIENITCWIFKGGSDASNKEQYFRCHKCSYYNAMHQKIGISVDDAADPVIIACEGVINNERSKALAQTWEALRLRSKNIILLDLSKTVTLYSSGLGVIASIYKDTKKTDGLFLVYCPPGFVKSYLETFKLDRIVNIVSDRKEAKTVWETYKKAAAEKTAHEIAQRAAEKAAHEAALIAAQKTAHEAAQKTATEKAAHEAALRQASLAAQKNTEKYAQQTIQQQDQNTTGNFVEQISMSLSKIVETEKKQPLTFATKKRPYCFDYWNGQNPQNSNRCAECFRKIKPSLEPCWLIENTVEGVKIQYVNEDCTSCAYYLEFGFNND
jgi:anti-anti-sigma factor